MGLVFKLNIPVNCLAATVLFSLDRPELHLAFAGFVIGTKIRAIPDLLADDCALLVDVGDIDALTECDRDYFR